MLFGMDDLQHIITLDNLRYNLEVSYPALYNFLLRRAVSYLRFYSHLPTYNIDDHADEIVENVMERLVRLGLIGHANREPQSSLYRMSDGEFRKFLDTYVEKEVKSYNRKYIHSTSLNLKSLEESEEEPSYEADTSTWATRAFITTEGFCQN